MCSAINAVDASALESIEAINHRLADSSVRMHLSEVKGPVMDALEKSHLLHDLTGKVWLSQNEAFQSLIRSSNDDDNATTIPDNMAARNLI
jgi:SulP family sulfate permease